MRTYRNQRVHSLLNWGLVVPQLTAASTDQVVDIGTAPPVTYVMEGPEWDEARREGCGSPAELWLLLAMRAAGLDEPEKQFEVMSPTGRLITRADFAYPQHGLLIYVDGLAFHSTIRQRIHDTSQTNQLQSMGYVVLRFMGSQVRSRPEQCIRQIQAAVSSAES